MLNFVTNFEKHCTNICVIVKYQSIINCVLFSLPRMSKLNNKFVFIEL